MSIRPLTNKFAATAVALATGGIVAMIPGKLGPGSGGLILWPLFGATNQLLAGLALMVISFYLWRRGLPAWLTAIPMAIMLIVPGWAMAHQTVTDFIPNEKWHLLVFSALISLLQLWLIVEAVLAWPKARNVLEEALPPLPQK